MKDDHVIILLESIDDKLQRFAEAMADVPNDIAQLKENVSTLKDDTKAIKAAVTDQSHELSNHEERIVELESAAHEPSHR